MTPFMIDGQRVTPKMAEWLLKIAKEGPQERGSIGKAVMQRGLGEWEWVRGKQKAGVAEIRLIYGNFPAAWVRAWHGGWYFTNKLRLTKRGRRAVAVLKGGAS